MAEHTHGSPCGYPSLADGSADHDQWVADLNRWAQAFERYATDDYVELYARGASTNYAAWNADEAARGEAMRAALAEMGPWFDSLWD